MKKLPKGGEPTSYTMDDIARRFLSVPPKPDRKAPAPKKKRKGKPRSPRKR